MQAFREGAKVLEGLVDGTIPLEDTALDAAKSTLVFSVTRGLSTAGSAANTSFVNQALKGVSQNNNVEQLEKYQSVTKEEVLTVLKKYVLPVFDPISSVAVAVTSLGKVEETGKSLREVGFEVEKREIEVGPEDLEWVDEDEMDIDRTDESGEESDSDSEAGRR